MTAVSFEHVDVVFGDKPAPALDLLDQGRSRDEIQSETGHIVGVRDASLGVEEGELVVLMGLSGSGKSTLLRCVNGLCPVTRGRVTVGTGAPNGPGNGKAANGKAGHGRSGDDTIDVVGCDARTLRRLRTERVAMVFQQFSLLPWRTVAENVAFGLELRGVPKAERGDVIADKLAMVGLEAWADKYAHELSGGMQQRVGLARAFATDAPILLMDEPFSALDPLIRDRLQDDLLGLQETLKKTILFVSHDLDEAMKLGNRIAIMEGGEIVQYGRPEEIVLEPANGYVADFVAHMNPLNVLRGASLMTAVADLPRDGDGALALDEAGAVRLRLDAEGRPSRAALADRDIPVAAATPETPPPRDTLATIDPEVSMKEVITLRQATGLPVVLVEDGRVVGAVCDGDVFAALLGRANGRNGTAPSASAAPA
ncbi:MAG: ATP-binding cassette domain-containing protein [Azospirillaceae bacterium]